ncbi:hypothetical protein TRICI_000726 [Trichomonascus ciferrii]|uniref:Glutathione S-transferase n=1 Tax=Trichomonascus ciferrii TaxID=44093 RepID=A0A642VAI7_9ASCO|nr:hypothetical protein TRICI_000726 [Trichomonascus ciferrii]
MQPIKVWGHFGPNPVKVFFVLEELGLPYEVKPVTFAEAKQPEYLKVNPNGRVPAIEDPNTGLTLWESGAIVEYLVDKYDTEHKLSFPAGTDDYYHAKQWLHFQGTGQGPYFGQGMWFQKYHHEKLPSALERYVKEINRVNQVLESQLTKNEWLVGNKLSFVDISFIAWEQLVSQNIDGFNIPDYPHVKQWYDKIASRPAIKRIIDQQSQQNK